MSAPAPAPRRQPGLLDGFSAAMAETWARAFPESQTVGLPVCDGCGRDDCELTESIVGTFACDVCIGDNAYDQDGDRR